ncbi:MAG: MFS transporter, partial [archaeon]
IKLLYITEILSGGRFFMPIIALFYIASKVTFEQFTFLVGVFAIVTLLLEVPSGAVADILGKRKTLLFARFFYIIEIVLLAFFNGFWFIALAELMSGVGVSLTSGTKSALLYDILKKDKREKDNKKISGTLSMISYISVAVVSILGAYLFTLHYKLPALASLPLIILAFLLTFFIDEPITKKSNKKLRVSNSFAHIKEGLQYLKKSNLIRYLSLLSIFTIPFITIIYVTSSVYLDKILIPIGLIGVVAFVSSIIGAIVSKRAHKIDLFLGGQKSILFVHILIILTMILMSLMIPYFGVLFYFLGFVAISFSAVVFDDYINQKIKSTHRATILSI